MMESARKRQRRKGKKYFRSATETQQRIDNERLRKEREKR